MICRSNAILFSKAILKLALAALFASLVYCQVAHGEAPGQNPQFLGLPLNLELLSVSKIEINWSVGVLDKSSWLNRESGLHNGMVHMKITLNPHETHSKKLVLIAPSCRVLQDGKELKIKRIKISKPAIVIRYEPSDEDSGGIEFLTDRDGWKFEPNYELTAWEFVVALSEQPSVLKIQLPFRSGAYLHDPGPKLRLFIPPSARTHRDTSVEFNVDSGIRWKAAFRSSRGDDFPKAQSTSTQLFKLDSKSLVLNINTQRRDIRGLVIGLTTTLVISVFVSFFAWKKLKARRIVATKKLSPGTIG